MATITRLVTQPDSGSTPNTAPSAGSFTPNAGDLLVVVLVGSATNDGTVPTASANGITFTAAVWDVYNSSGNTTGIFIANQLVGPSPVGMTVTWSPTDTATSTVIDIYAVRGSGGLAGSTAIRQSRSVANGTAGATPAISYFSNVLTGNVTLLAVANLSAPAGLTEPTGWTELNDTNCTVPTAGLEVVARESGFTGQTVTWGSTSATNYGVVAVEIDTSPKELWQTGIDSAAGWDSTVSNKDIVVQGCLTGDRLTTIAMGDDGPSGGGSAVTAATSLTSSGSTSSWTEIEEDLPANGGTGWLHSATATVSADGDITVRVSRTQSGTAQMWGYYIVRTRGMTGGIGNHGITASGSTEVVNLSVSTDSWVMFGQFDWTAQSPPSGFTPSSSIVVRNTQIPTQNTVSAAYWHAQTSGTRDYGTNGTQSSTNLRCIAVELLATPTGAYTGTAARAETITITAAGVVARSSGATRSESFGVTATGAVGKRTGASVPLALAITAAGSVSKASGATRSESFAVTTTGAVGKATGASVAETFAVSTTGRADHASTATRPETFAVTTSGTVGKATGAAVALGIAITASGTVGGANYSGTASRPETITVTAAGTVGEQTGASVPLAFGITAAGVVGKQAGASVALTDTISTAGTVGKQAGATVALTDTITTAGVTARASGVSRPETFAVTATGRADHAATASVPLLLTITTSGAVGKVSPTSLPLSLAITATGQVSSPVQRIGVTASATNQPTITAFSPTLPTHIAGDRLTLVVTGKYDTTTTPTINQGWTTVEAGTGGTGSQAADTGPTFWVVYQKDATSSSETAPTVTPVTTLPNSWEWFCVSHRPGAGMQWADTIASGGVGYVVSASDTTTGSPLTGTTNAFSPQVTGGDAIFAVGVIPTDLGTALGTTTVTETGLSGGTLDATSTNYTENSTGQDTAAVWAGWTGFTGTGSAGLACSFTVTGATNQSGSIIGIAFRQTASVTNYNGQASRAETFTVTATGRADHSTGASVAETFGVTAAGTTTHASGATRAETVTITAAGTKGVQTGASRAETFGVTTTGVVGKQVGATVPLSFSITATGSVGAAGIGEAIRDETITITATGTVAHSAGASRALTLAITTGGALGKTAGANRALTFGVTAAGAKGLSRGASVPEVLTILATGTKAAYAGASLPLSLTITATGVASTTLTGTAALPLTLAIVATGSVYVVPPGTAVQGGKITLLNYAGTVYLTGSGKATILEE